MYYTYKMLEATNKQEAIISILDVIDHNPLFLNQCTSKLFAVVKTLPPADRKKWLDLTPFYHIKDLFIEIKTAYYKATPIQF